MKTRGSTAVAAASGWDAPAGRGKPRRLYRLTLWLVVPLLLVALAGPALAVRSSTTEVRQISDGQVVGTSTLTRRDDLLALRIETGSLPSGTYTVWWVLFNEPGNCSDGECGMDDLSNEDAEASALWATGGVVGNDGVGEFFAYLTEHEALGQVLLGDGLTDAKKAEVHLVIRWHGPPSGDVDTLKDQFTTVEGGCSPCEDQQFAVHK